MRCRPERWWRGLPLLALLGSAGLWLVTPAVEADLAARLRERAAAAGAGWAGFEVAGRDAVLTGEAPSPEARAELLAALAGSGARLRDRTTTRTAPAGPAWSASREGGRLVLRGRVPDPATREALAAEARRLSPGLALVDETEVGEGAPPALAEGARAALRLAALLADALVALRGPSLDAQGTAADPDSYAAAMAVLRALPDGVQAGQVAITPPTLQPFALAVARDGEVLALTGHVPSEAARAEIAAAARALVPDAALDDRMVTALGAPPGLDVVALARRALELLAGLDGGRIAVEGVGVTAEARAGDRAALPAFETALRASMPAPLTLSSLRLQVVPVVPYTFGARRGGGAVTLTGHVPDEAARAETLRAARRHILGDRIVDRLRLGDGAPPGFARAAEHLLEQLGQLASGEAAMRGTALTVQGEGLYAQAVEAQGARAQRAPPGFTAQASLRVRGAEPPLDAAACARALEAAVPAGAIAFEPGGSAFKRASYGPLDAAAAVLRRCGAARVEIGGHLDAEANAEATRELSLRRAQAVRDHLVRAGIEPGRLQAFGYGGSRPLVPNEGEANRARNQRVELVVRGEAGGEP